MFEKQNVSHLVLITAQCYT